ncbi:MAG: hypothetical protein JO042_16750 [Sinobacteraceae bacterium]|nr:hypothetical protein [Nevskiaceae bacterium]
MKMIVTVPFALVTLGMLGCSQQANTAAPALQAPAAAAPSSNDKNMFGESKDDAAGNAANARAENYDSKPAPAPADSTGSSTAAAGSAPPK